MLSRAALERVGPFDEDYFFSFEDADWCVRACYAGFGLAVVKGARARHVGGLTIGRGSPERLYYGARNRQRCVEKLRPRRGLARSARRAIILGLSLAHALRQSEVPRGAALGAVLRGYRDACRGRFGKRARGSRGDNAPD
jgi:GT2 family glycosyltransferase